MVSGTAPRRDGTEGLSPAAYALLGFFWGLPVPFFSVLSDLYASGRALSPALLAERPIHLLFGLYPVLLAAIFGVLGSSLRRAARERRELLEKREQHERDLREIEGKQKEADRLKARFIANVLHELKTPLLAVRGFNEAILEGRYGPVTDAQREGLEAAVRNVERLQKLAEDLLEFERVDSEGYKPEFSEFDLIPLIQEVLRNSQPLIEARKLQVQLQLPKRLEVRADREKIGRVMLNLLSNAIKFSPEGAPFGVGVAVGEEDGQALFTVWDRGPGIPTDAQKYLFTRFWQADGPSRRRQGGTGLGLAIVKGILDAHGSAIRIVSGEGQGTAVHFTLPLAESGIRKPVPSS
jgi:signal transduction histidine kinase